MTIELAHIIELAFLATLSSKKLQKPSKRYVSINEWKASKTLLPTETSVIVFHYVSEIFDRGTQKVDLSLNLFNVRPIAHKYREGILHGHGIIGRSWRM